MVAPFTGAGSSTAWHNGWTVGAGWEYGLTRNWIVGVEYDYASFETHGYGLGGAAGIYNFDLKPRDVQSAVARLSYKFNATAGREILIVKRRTIQSPGAVRGFFCCRRPNRRRVAAIPSPKIRRRRGSRCP